MELENIKNNLRNNWLVTILLFLTIALFVFEFYNNAQLNQKINGIVLEQNLARINTDNKESSFNGRYQIYISPITAKVTFLIDNKEGTIYSLVEDPDTKKLWWRKTDVEGE